MKYEIYIISLLLLIMMSMVTVNSFSIVKKLNKSEALGNASYHFEECQQACNRLIEEDEDNDEDNDDYVAHNCMKVCENNSRKELKEIYVDGKY